MGLVDSSGFSAICELSAAQCRWCRTDYESAVGEPTSSARCCDLVGDATAAETAPQPGSEGTIDSSGFMVSARIVTWSMYADGCLTPGRVSISRCTKSSSDSSASRSKICGIPGTVPHLIGPGFMHGALLSTYIMQMPGNW